MNNFCDIGKYGGCILGSLGLFTAQECKDSETLSTIINESLLTTSVLDRMSKILQRLGYDSRGGKDVREGLYGRLKEINGEEAIVPGMIREGKLYGDWASAYLEAIGQKASPVFGKKSPNNIHIDRGRIRQLGYTDSFSEAGYITPAGRLIDLSGKREGGPSGTRSYDHREAGGLAGMQELMSEGNIRMDYNSGSFDIAVQPTRQQFRVIEEITRDKNGEVIIDLSDGLGTWSESSGFYNSSSTSFQYDAGTSARKILNDIDRFFRGRITV